MIEEVVYYENEHTWENVSSSEIKDIIVNDRKVEEFSKKLPFKSVANCLMIMQNPIFDKS